MGFNEDSKAKCCTKQIMRNAVKAREVEEMLPMNVLSCENFSEPVERLITSQARKYFNGISVWKSWNAGHGPWLRPPQDEQRLVGLRFDPRPFNKEELKKSFFGEQSPRKVKNHVGCLTMRWGRRFKVSRPSWKLPRTGPLPLERGGWAGLRDQIYLSKLWPVLESTWKKRRTILYKSDKNMTQASVVKDSTWVLVWKLRWIRI